MIRFDEIHNKKTETLFQNVDLIVKQDAVFCAPKVWLSMRETAERLLRQCFETAEGLIRYNTETIWRSMQEL